MSDKAVIVGKKSRPWEKRSIKVEPRPTDNAQANRAALTAMDACEVACGIPVAEVVAFHREQRQRVLERLGLAA